MHISGGFLRAMPPALALVLALLLPGPARAAQVTLRWDMPSTGAAEYVKGYNIYYGRTPRNYKNSVFTGNETTYTVKDLEAGPYYFAVTSVDDLGNESAYSNEVSKVFGATGSPFIYSLSVSQGIEGTRVTVLGADLGEKKGSVYVGARKARVIHWSAAGDSVTFISPKKLPYETYEVGVVTAHGARSGNVLPYQVMQANIRGSSTGSGAPGAPATLTGEYFGPKPKVYFSSTSRGKAKRMAARVTGYSVADNLNCTVNFSVPSLDAGPYSITVVNSQGISNNWNFEVK